MNVVVMIVLGVAVFIVTIFAINFFCKCKKNSPADALSYGHISELTLEKIRPFFDGIAVAGYTGIVICYPLIKRNDNDFSDINGVLDKIFEDKKGVALIWCDSNKRIVKALFCSFDSMDEELSNILEKGSIQEKGYVVITD